MNVDGNVHMNQMTAITFPSRYLKIGACTPYMADELTAADVMSDGIIAIDREASVQEAAKKMRDEDIRSLVVIDDSEAVGIIVGRDVVYNVVSQGLNAQETTVEEIMTTNLVTAPTTEDIAEIARSMIRHDISRIPIIRGDQVVGIVTQSNIIRAWPSYIEVLQEENMLYPMDNVSAEPETTSGECDRCENYSDELVRVNGEFLCPECRVEA